MTTRQTFWQQLQTWIDVFESTSVPYHQTHQAQAAEIHELKERVKNLEDHR